MLPPSRREPRYAQVVTRPLIDRPFLAWSTLASVGALLAFGLVSAIIPNPVFGRQIPPDAFAIAVWLASAPLMGVVVATYLAPAPVAIASLREQEDPRRSWLGYAGAIGTFLAVGCPVCNKVALVLLGTSGALNLWAPLQPVVGALSLVLLCATLTWRLRVRSRAGGCRVPGTPTA
jgi:hypothetical protein